MKNRTQKIIELLKTEYGDAECALTHRNAFELLAATILSAQCTDQRVNMVTPELFAAFPTPDALAKAPVKDIEKIIRSTGFYRNKAKNLKGMAQGLVERFGGNVPQTLEELISLPGVARKTANVVMGTAFEKASGVVVDTHVMRITKLLSLTEHDSPVQIERDLMSILPESEWIMFSHRLIHHGRKICIARRPQCELCCLKELCPSAGKQVQPKKNAPKRADKKFRPAQIT